jgi:hypothetical protein
MQLFAECMGCVPQKKCVRDVITSSLLVSQDLFSYDREGCCILDICDFDFKLTKITSCLQIVLACADPYTLQ